MQYIVMVSIMFTLCNDLTRVITPFISSNTSHFLVIMLAILCSSCLQIHNLLRPINQFFILKMLVIIHFLCFQTGVHYKLYTGQMIQCHLVCYDFCVLIFWVSPGEDDISNLLLYLSRGDALIEMTLILWEIETGFDEDAAHILLMELLALLLWLSK